MTTIPLPSNFNNKIGCKFMIHIMKPAKSMKAKHLDELMVRFESPEKSADYVLTDYVEMNMKDIPAHLRMSAYGPQSINEFRLTMLQLYGIRQSESCGVYFFILT